MSTKQSSRNNIKDSEAGIVAVMVTMIMMLVISLIVLGFAQVSRRTQRNALDAQLSTQAYYAAESGVNDAISVMRSLPLDALQPKNTCDDSSVYQFDAQSLSTIGKDVSYTCLLINPVPSSLFYTIGENSSQTIKLASDDGSNFKTLKFSWVPPSDQKTQPLSNCPTVASQYPKVAGAAGGWNCKYAVLRSELVPTKDLNRASFMSNTNVNFLDPVNAVSTGTITWGADKGKSVAAQCSEVPTPKCTATVNFGGAGVPSYYLRLGTLYRSASVTITGTDSSDKPLKFAGVQAQIDVTGKASDVLRRILVAVKLDGVPGSTPMAALSSGDSVCKRFSVTKGSFNIDDFNVAGDAGNPLCQVQDIGTAQ
jgi:type II secretory pathway pseudopilin PulG